MARCRNALLVSVILAACTHQPPGVPRPSTLLYCYVLSAGPWYLLGPGRTRVTVASVADLPRAINLGTVHGRKSPLQVGTLVPDTGDVRVLWRLLQPDSLVLDFVPAKGGFTFLEGIRLQARVVDDSLVGEAARWSDAMGYEPTAPVVGRRVRCPAGA